MDWSLLIPVYQEVAQDIKKQKNRIGGNFAVTETATKRSLRDAIKEVIPECIFITLTLSRETQRKRCFARHGDGKQSEGILKFFTAIFDACELPGEGEKNCFNVNITEEMSDTEVMKQVLEILKKNGH